MGWTQTIADADVYFDESNHIRTHDWFAFSLQERTAAFAQSVRELQVSLDTILSDPASSTSSIRQDYAAFEQSLFILENTPRKKRAGELVSVIELGDDDTNEVIDRRGVLISPMASRFLGLSRIKMVRG